MKSLEVLESDQYWKVWHSSLATFIKNYQLRSKKIVNILEAGCGNHWHLDMKGIDYRVTGVDVSREALEIRRYEKNLQS